MLSSVERLSTKVYTKMFALTLACVLAVASAAPHYHHHHGPHHAFGGYGRYSDLDLSAFSGDIFDTANFWQRINTEMADLQKMLNSFHSQFNAYAASAGVDGNSYKVRISLPRFNAKEIVVKARDGMVMVQAVHNTADGGQSSYVDIRTLPTNVDPAGLWGYSDETLTITFPLKGATTETAVTEEPHVTQAPAISREEMETVTTTIEDVDVGLRTAEVETNEISNEKVEATTYAVDLKDQFEFVPITYRK